MPDGHPDLQGTYDLNTLTPVERPQGMPAVLSAEDTARREAGVTAALRISEQPLDAERSAPPEGGDGSTGAAGNVGGYNTFWLDPGAATRSSTGKRGRRWSSTRPMDAYRR